MLRLGQAIGAPVTASAKKGHVTLAMQAGCSRYVSVPGPAWPDHGSAPPQTADDWCASNTNCAGSVGGPDAGTSDGRSARQEADDWCAANCVVGFCPEDKCRCAEGSQQPRTQRASAEVMVSAEVIWSCTEGPTRRDNTYTKPRVKVK